MPGTDLSFKVQLPLPTIGLELYQLEVHIRAKKSWKATLLSCVSEWVCGTSVYSDVYFSILNVYLPINSICLVSRVHLKPIGYRCLFVH